MARIRVGGQAVSQVGQLLSTISSDASVAPDVRANAQYWARAVRRTMDRRDLQTLSWVLLNASQEKAVPADERRSARYWAANLEARC
jgi:uncharacterized protein (UPF0147 family)